MDIIEILKGAIEGEDEAREKYIKLAGDASDPETRAVLEQLARDEQDQVDEGPREGVDLQSQSKGTLYRRKQPEAQSQKQSFQYLTSTFFCNFHPQNALRPLMWMRRQKYSEI
jgi:hypothetical protein